MPRPACTRIGTPASLAAAKIASAIPFAEPECLGARVQLDAARAARQAPFCLADRIVRRIEPAVRDDSAAAFERPSEYAIVRLAVARLPVGIVKREGARLRRRGRSDRAARSASRGPATGRPRRRRGACGRPGRCRRAVAGAPARRRRTTTRRWSRRRPVRRRPDGRMSVGHRSAPDLDMVGAGGRRHPDQIIHGPQATASDDTIDPWSSRRSRRDGACLARAARCSLRWATCASRRREGSESIRGSMVVMRCVSARRSGGERAGPIVPARALHRYGRHPGPQPDT